MNDNEYMKLAKRIAKHAPPGGWSRGNSMKIIINKDGVLRWMKEHGIEVNRENYLRIAFMGSPPEEPLDGEIEAQLPDEIRINPETRAWKEELDADLAALKVRTARKR